MDFPFTEIREKNQEAKNPHTYLHSPQALTLNIFPHSLQRNSIQQFSIISVPAKTLKRAEKTNTNTPLSAHRCSSARRELSAGLETVAFSHTRCQRALLLLLVLLSVSWAETPDSPERASTPVGLKSLKPNWLPGGFASEFRVLRPKGRFPR